MAIVYVESFDFWTTAQYLIRGWTDGGGAGNIAMHGGRWGTGQSLGRVLVNDGLKRSLPSSYSTVIFGWAYVENAANAGVDHFNIKAGSTLTCRVSITAGNKLQIKNSSGTVIATGTSDYFSGVWHYIEVKLVINGATGSVTVHLDGATEIATTTGNFGSTNIDGFSLGGASINGDFDDIYVADTTGSAPNNDFLGDSRVITLYPTSDGASTQWTPSTGTAHWSLVDETTPNSDTDYVASSTPNQIDSYGFQDVSASATVFAVQTNLFARKVDSGTRQVADLIRQSSTNYVGTTYTLASTYSFYTKLYDKDPTNATWTASNVNADEFGVKLIT